MNYLAHGWRCTADPYFLAGTAVPDWLCVADRRVRVRSKRAAEWIACGDSVVSAIARGICQHHSDDQRFHTGRAFAELSLDFAARVRRCYPAGEGLRSWFLGHILVEILLDAAMIEQYPERLHAYYAALSETSSIAIQRAVNYCATRPTTALAGFVAVFCRERFLWDYLDDGKLLMRLNQVMRRARLAALPPSFNELLPAMRAAVRARWTELLESAAPNSIGVPHEIRHEPVVVDR
jgi:hypothetical protein